tara:strand:- start:1624 stop:2424 length:801 start_codon:yes stop_codon:yes gene_type:complete
MEKVLYVVPFRGKFELLERFIMSLFTQLNDNWEAYIVDDNSTHSIEEEKKIITLIQSDPRIHYFWNSERHGPLHNVYNVVVNSLKHKGDVAIIAQADGDDWLLPEATTYILRLHEKFDITYGQFIRHAPDTPWDKVVGHCAEYPLGVRLSNSYEDYPWLASHLKSFKRKCFLEIPYEMFIDPRNGRFWDSSYDMAYMLPMLKMADSNQIVFNPIITYVYNMEGWGEEDGGHVLPETQEDTSHFINEAIKLYINEGVRWHEDSVSGD